MKALSIYFQAWLQPTLEAYRKAYRKKCLNSVLESCKQVDTDLMSILRSPAMRAHELKLNIRNLSLDLFRTFGYDTGLHDLHGDFNFVLGFKGKLLSTSFGAEKIFYSGFKQRMEYLLDLNLIYGNKPKPVYWEVGADLYCEYRCHKRKKMGCTLPCPACD